MRRTYSAAMLPDMMGPRKEPIKYIVLTIGVSIGI